MQKVSPTAPPATLSWLPSGGGLAAWCALALVYAFPFPHFEYLQSPNELSRLYQVRAIVDDHTLSVNGAVQRFGEMRDLSEFEGRLYPNKAPGVSFLGAAVYAVVRFLRGGAEHVDNRGLLYFLRLFCGIVPTLVVLVPLRRYVARTCGDARAADAAILVWAFGTLGFTYALLLFSHQLAAVLLIGSFLALEHARRRDGPFFHVLGGLLAGYAVVTEYTSAPIAVVLAMYGVATAQGRLAALVRIAAGAIPCALLLGAYHQAAWGDPFSPGYAHVQSKVFAGWHAQGVMGVTTPKVASLVGNLFSPSRGLFTFSPVLIPALFGLLWYQQEDRSGAIVAGLVVAFYCFIAAAFLYEAWGWMVGPRHLTPMVAFLVAPLGVLIARLRAKSASAGGTVLLAVVAGLGAASVLITAGLAVVYPHVPEEFVAAIAHLFLPLVRDGMLPNNLQRMLTGTVATSGWGLYFGAIALIAAVVVAKCADPGRRTAIAGVSTLVVFLFALAQLALVPAPTAKETDFVRWIEDRWEPTPANVQRGIFAKD